MADEVEVKDLVVGVNEGVETEAPNHEDFWTEQYEEATAGGTQFFFFKKDLTRFRPIGLGTDPRNWVRQVESIYNGSKSKKYLVLGYEIQEKNSTETAKASIGVFSKGAWGQICQSQKLGYDFFTEKGTAIIVMRQNTGQRITYNVMAAPVPTVPIPNNILIEAKEFLWDEIVAAYNKMQEGRDGPNAQDSAANGQSPTSIADQILNSPNRPEGGPGQTDPAW